MGKFILKKTASGYRFNLLAVNSRVILTSETYTTRASCLTGINAVKKNARSDKNYERKTSSNGQYYFNLRAANNEIIGTSEMYQGAGGRNNGIESVKSNAPGAKVEE